MVAERETCENVLSRITAQYRTSTVGETPSVGTHPPLLPVDLLPYLPFNVFPTAVAEFLATGAHGGDGSATVASVAHALRDIGLTQQQSLSYLAANSHVMEVALRHRNGKQHRAIEYLWKHHVLRAGSRSDPASVFADLSTEQVGDLRCKFMPPITMSELESAKLTPRVIVPNLLFADVRNRIAAGGTGKTTLALFEATVLALGRPLWGRTPPRTVRTVVVTREDSRQILVGRLREIMRELELLSSEVQSVLEHINIIDLSDKPFRVSEVRGDVVVPDEESLNWLHKIVEAHQPDWIIFDPLVSFGVGESRVNDAEQGLIEAFRILRNRMGCCIEGIHHTGKANSREKSLDQYAGRNGSALADGCRMVAVLQPLDPAEWLKATGVPLEPNETGLVMALPKLSYAAAQEPVFIRRSGYLFTQQTSRNTSPEQASANRQTAVLDFLHNEYKANRRYSKSDLEASLDQLGMTRDQLRSALVGLKTRGLIVPVGGRGQAGAHLEPMSSAAPVRGGIQNLFDKDDDE